MRGAEPTACQQCVNTERKDRRSITELGCIRADAQRMKNVGIKSVKVEVT